ncbi:unnamed protein product [Cunninghamella blakesleeana]
MHYKRILDENDVELSVNEWKSSRVSYLGLQQQVKNIRTNCAILNNLMAKTNSKINGIMAMDFIELKSYLQSTKLPTFSNFINQNTSNIDDWSFSTQVNNPIMLYGIWKQKYCKLYKEKAPSAKNM